MVATNARQSPRSPKQQQPAAAQESLELVAPTAAAAVGGDLRVSLACPKCGASGWIQWKDLRHGLRCSKCRCQFVLNRSGKAQSVAELPHVRYTCPRCKQSGSLPEVAAVRKAECTTCKLPLVRGPDQRLHEVAEAERMTRAARLAAKSDRSPWWTKHFVSSQGRLRKATAGLAALLVVVSVSLVVMMIARLLDASPDGRARDFTYTCLAGNWKAAGNYMRDDAVQRAEFDRWRVRYFTSILDKYRPAGDQVDVEVKLIDETPQSRAFQVTLRSPLLGSRVHDQQWQLDDQGRWLFDAAATIRAHDHRQ